MAETSRSINHRLNELSSKANLSRARLDAPTALQYSKILKGGILGKDKQEKVNSIVVLAKLLDLVSTPNSGATSEGFSEILDVDLFDSLFSIVSMKMSSETYKAILKVAFLSISAGPFPAHFGESSIDIYVPVFQGLVANLDTIDVMTAKLSSSELKVVLSSIYLVSGLIEKALRFDYDRIITISGRLKHVRFFSTAEKLRNDKDSHVTSAIATLQNSYYRLNEYLSVTRFDMSLVSHQVMLTNLFIFLDVSLNEFGAPASTEEYVKAGFTADPKAFVTRNFSILLAMDLKVFLKDSDIAFKKKFHEELIMSDHNRTFPIYLFIKECTSIWLDVFHDKTKFPHIGSHILSWELMIHYSMNNCLLLWQETESRLESVSDIEGIMDLLKYNIFILENTLAEEGYVEESLEEFTARTTEQIRREQFQDSKREHAEKWSSRFVDFDNTLAKETIDFVCEQRVMQLLKGSWVHTEAHAQRIFEGKTKKADSSNYYFIMLSPNRRLLHYKEFNEITTLRPTLEELESSFVVLKDIHELKSSRIGNSVGEADKAKSKSLISVKGTISYDKIILFDRQAKVMLSFYTNSEDKKAVWLDGLRMLKGLVDSANLSTETAQQISSLRELRKNTQLLMLQGKDFASAAPESEIDSDDSDEFYDIGELTRAAQDFHFQ